MQARIILSLFSHQHNRDETKLGRVRVIQDYGQKPEPQKWKESQTFRFAKAGLSQYGVTFLMRADNFTMEQLIKMLGEEAARKIKHGDMVVYTVVLYGNDAKQDWVHSFYCLRAALKLFHERFPSIKEVLLRSDGAGNFKCSSSILAMILLSKWSGLRIIELCFSEAGGGKDFTDSLVQKHKLMLAEAVRKRGGTACTAEELVANIAQGYRENGQGGSNDTREIIIPRVCVPGAAEGGIPGISSLYYFKLEYSASGEFVGLRVWAHRGIGEGKFYSKEQCSEMFSGKDQGD